MDLFTVSAILLTVTAVLSYVNHRVIGLPVTIGVMIIALSLLLIGPNSIVVAGLLIGNQGRRLELSAPTHHHLDVFWELIDVILIAVLFVLIGLEILILTFTRQFVAVGVFMIPVILLARFISVGIPITLLRAFKTFSPGVIPLLTWSGLRGGISIALALSLPMGPERQVILVMTYTVVVFSIVIQGLTIDKLVKWLVRIPEPKQA